MKKKKLTIDLGNLSLTEEEQLKLLEAIHKTVSAKSKSAEPQKGKRVTTRQAPMKAIASLAASATISATFRDTEPGLSKLVATHKGISKTITQTDSITFENVQAGHLIGIDVITLGKSEITIDRKAKPQEKSSTDSSFRFLFEILE